MALAALRFPGRAAFGAAAAGLCISAVAFASCVVASTAYGWHRAVTVPGIAVSVIVMTGCAVILNLTADGGPP